MAKNAFTDWDTTPANNTDVGGINIDEGCPPSNINNAIRTAMAQLKAGVDSEMAYVTKSGSYLALPTDNNAYYRFTAAATVTITPVATLGANWHLWLKADGADITVDPNASETINGATTLIIRNGESALVISSGSEFFASVYPSNSSFQFYQTKAGNYTALDSDYTSTIAFTSAATLALDVTANLRTNWRIEVWNNSTGLVTIDPDSTNTINGATTFVMQPGQRAQVYKTSATAFQAAFYADTYSGPQLRGLMIGLGLSTAADAANDVTMAAGAAASTVAPYDLMQLTTALTKQLDVSWAVGNNAGGLDTGAVGNNTYYMHLIRRPDTGVTDWLFSLSSTAPTMPTNYTQRSLRGYVVRSGGTNGPPFVINPLPADLDPGGFAPFASALIDTTGSGSIISNRGITSITRNGIGDVTLTFPTRPSSNINVQGFALQPTAGTTGFIVGENPLAAPTTTSFRISVRQGASVVDCAKVHVTLYQLP
jgi:hypothetical protein